MHCLTYLYFKYVYCQESTLDIWVLTAVCWERWWDLYCRGRIRLSVIFNAFKWDNGELIFSFCQCVLFWVTFCLLIVPSHFSLLLSKFFFNEHTTVVFIKQQGSPIVTDIYISRGIPERGAASGKKLLCPSIPMMHLKHIFHEILLWLNNTSLRRRLYQIYV